MKLRRVATVEIAYEDHPQIRIHRGSKTRSGHKYFRVYDMGRISADSKTRLLCLLDNGHWTQHHNADWDHKSRTLHCDLSWSHDPTMEAIKRNIVRSLAEMDALWTKLNDIGHLNQVAALGEYLKGNSKRIIEAWGPKKST